MGCCSLCEFHYLIVFLHDYISLKAYGVHRGLDKCAELLMNILEIQSEEKEMKRTTVNSTVKPTRLSKNRKKSTKSSSKNTAPKKIINVPTERDPGKR